MRIYTNYDGWMMTRHDIKLGRVIYKDTVWDLDHKSQKLRWVLELIKDNVITMIPDQSSKNTLTHLESLMFSFKPRSLRRFNQRDDGSKNPMQFKAMARNLIECGFIQSIQA